MTKLLYLATEAGYFFSHRYALAKAAQKEGFEVFIATTPGEHAHRFLKEGFHLYPLTHMRRGGTHPLRELISIFEIRALYKKIQPDIIHHVGLKPVLYGTIAASFCSIKKEVNALTGLGYLFIHHSWKARWMRRWVWILLSILLKKKYQTLIVQNKDDFDLFSKIVPEQQIVLIRGSGVDTRAFHPLKNKKGRRPFKCVLAARMLWDKGIGETIEAARLLKTKGLAFELILAGSLDLENPQGIPERVIKGWVHEGICSFFGKVEDMVFFYQHADVAVLPSYREGLPKSLLEAAACGLPIITTDAPGCRELVTHERTGLLVPVKDVIALANAMERLLNDQRLRETLGQAARRSVVRTFSDKMIISATLALYEKVQLPK